MSAAAMAAGSLARRIQASIRADACRGRDVERIGTFVATFTRDDRNPFLNYAIPEEGAKPARDDVEALIDAFVARDRRPRLEYRLVPAPSVEPAPAAAGFAIEGRLPLMTCAAAGDLRELAVDGIKLVTPTSEDEYRAVGSVQWEAYEEEGDVPQRVVEGLRRSAEAGGIVVLARDAAAGEPAGAGQCTPAHDGLTELTSVGVRPAFRRRGIAHALAARLASAAFAGGATSVFLMAHGEAEARIYARAGFRREYEVLLVSRP